MAFDVEAVLVLTVEPYKASTRARKSAKAYALSRKVTYLSLARVGRTGRWDEPGHQYVDGIDIVQVDSAAPALEPRPLNQVRNLLICYLPALIKVVVRAWRTPAEVVHVTGMYLGPVGILHKLRHRSKLVLDVTERPGLVSAKGSVASLVSRVELPFLRFASSRVDVVSVVTCGDVETLRSLGFERVELVRNAPLRAWRAPYEDLPRRKAGELSAVVIGSIFEGRGYEMLLRAVALARPATRVSLRIVGTGRPQYLNTLRVLADELGITDQVEWVGPISSETVSAMYLTAEVGLVLYESTDAGNDGLSNKLMECVATGRPVIAGDLPENRRFVTEHEVGWLTPLTDDGLASVMTQVSLSANLAPIADSCRKIGDEWLNWEDEFARLRSHLDSSGL